MHHSFIYSFLFALITLVTANVEKEIFLAPAKDNNGVFGLPRIPTIRHLKEERTLRTTLNTSFEEHGAQHWVLLDQLEPGRRYEVRICWPATQPTDFQMNLYAPTEVSSSSLSSGMKASSGIGGSTSSSDGWSSQLYLQVFAKTAYYSSNQTRMENPEPVDVDIILDPFWLGVVPESLLLIGGLILIVAVGAWWVGGWVHSFLLGIAAREQRERDKKEE